MKVLWTAPDQGSGCIQVFYLFFFTLILDVKQFYFVNVFNLDFLLA